MSIEQDARGVKVTYREWAPPADLAEDVRCVWRSRLDGAAPILPDGHLDLMVIGDHAFVAGPDTEPNRSTLPGGPIVHGIRFATGRAHRVLGLPADELRDQRVDLADLWGSDGRRIGEWLAFDPSRLVTLVEQRLASDPGDADRSVDAAVRLLTTEPRARVAGLSDELGLSERQFRRRFTAAVGYGPATYLRIVRMQRVRALAGIRPTGGLADLAYAAGYADQAHMSRELRDLTGATPRRLLRPVDTSAR